MGRLRCDFPASATASQYEAPRGHCFGRFRQASVLCRPRKRAVAKIFKESLAHIVGFPVPLWCFSPGGIWFREQFAEQIQNWQGWFDQKGYHRPVHAAIALLRHQRRLGCSPQLMYAHYRSLCSRCPASIWVAPNERSVQQKLMTTRPSRRGRPPQTEVRKRQCCYPSMQAPACRRLLLICQSPRD